MAGLLVSVRNAAEAQAAIAGGAQLIDIKEPHSGSLGAASVRQWREVIDICADRVPVSVALGELNESELPQRLGRLPQVQFAKIGLSWCRKCDDWIARWRWAIEQLPIGTAPVAVIYADTAAARVPSADQIRQQAHEMGCRVMLWDTYDKNHGGLLDHLPLQHLRREISAARCFGMQVVLAGSLTALEIGRLRPLRPDWFAVRGAVCDNTRTGHLRPHLVQQLATLLTDA